MTKSVPLSEMSKAELTDERERLRGLQRAHAPLNKTLSFDERARGMSLYSFRED